MSKYVRKEKSQRKHPVISSSSSIIKAPVNPEAIKGRPEWKGPGFVKKTAKQPSGPVLSSSVSTGPHIQENRLPSELQQLLLNIFRTTFPICQDYEALKPMLTEIKKALDARDIERAFGGLDSMEVYAARWSPSRALCYAAVLAELCEEFGEETCIQILLKRESINTNRSSESSSNVARSAKAVCFGGGAAEIMAFGALLRYLYPDSDMMTTQSVSVSGSTSPLSGLGSSSPSPLLDLHLVDAASWAAAICSLESGLTTPPTLSKYASASARANNAAFICPYTLKTSFQQCDILHADQDELGSMIGKKPALITLLFTLNDFLVSNVAKSTAFFLKLSNAAPKNSLLLMIDNLDATSEIILGKDDQVKEKKAYPMHYLLDMVLTEKQMSAAADQKPAWEKLLGDQSRHFRIPEGLKYPIGLENLKFQVYLYKKL